MNLEDRGLLSWNRVSNTYSVHPIIRSYAYAQLGDADRVQANSRVVDHFQSQPAEDVWRATGLADLARTCAGADTRHYTPSDFPDVSMSQDNLDQLLADIAGANEKD